MRHLLILLFLISSIEVISQHNFKNDTAFYQYKRWTYNEIDSIFNLKKNNEFEMQFWIHYSKTMKSQVLFLTLNDNKWNARFFERIRKDKDTLIELIVDQSNLSTLWKTLEKRQILTIPKEEDLRDKNGNEINDPVHDGISYSFLFYNLNSKRNYSYHCPKSFSNRYKKVKAYGRVVKIIETLLNYIGLNKKYIC